MKRRKIYAVLAILFVCAALGWWGGFLPRSVTEDNRSYNAAGMGSVEFTRDIGLVDYSAVKFSPWNVKAASAYVDKQDKKDYTVMIYMNGSDLESEGGAATDDLIEILDSGVDSGRVNIVLLTGGANRWQNDVVPENDCVLWRLSDGYLEEITGVGLVNMGNAGTLSSFIDFSMDNFPADRYGLILWDHGGGAIAGYGHDEKFVEGNLTLLDMDYAFKMAGLNINKLEFLGFDSCLMATAEMAVVASEYADYLIASEDLEPEDGWNYGFLSELNRSDIDGAEVGVAVVDYFMDYYGRYSGEILTMSVIDLSKAALVMDSLGKLMNKCSESLDSDKAPAFTALARSRYRTKTFGKGSPRDNECDMVDIGDMAAKLYDFFPEESDNVLAALNSAVIYNRHNSRTDLKGLSVYYVYGGKQTADVSLATYSTLEMSDAYTEYLYDFSGMLNSGGTARTRAGQSGANMPEAQNVMDIKLTMWKPAAGKEGSYVMMGIQDRPDENDADENYADSELWPRINGNYICMYSIDDSAEHSLFASPIRLNGRDCDLIIQIGPDSPGGKILGARQDDGFIIQKGFDKIKDGDKISFYYQLRSGSESAWKEKGGMNDKENGRWFRSGEITVTGGLKLDWADAGDENAYYGLLLTDFCGNEYYAELKNTLR